MKTPWDVRLEETIRTLVRFAKDQGRAVTAEDLISLESQVFASASLEPSTDDLKLYPFEKLDEIRFLAYHYAVEADMNFITKSLDEIEAALKNLLLASEVEQMATLATQRIANLHLALLSAATFIEGITREIAIPDEIDTSSSNLQSLGGSLSMRAENSRLGNRSTYVTDDIDITVTQEQSMTGNQITGNRLSVLDNSFRRGFNLRVFTERVDTIETTLRIRSRFPATNRLTLELSPSVVGTQLEVDILPSLGSSVQNVFSDVVNREEVVIEFAATPIEQLIIRATKDFPDVKNDQFIAYDFTYEKIRAENTTTARSGRALTTAIELPDGTEYVALLAEDFIPEGSSIRYEIAPVADEDEIPTTFFEITPNNQDPASTLTNNELPADRFIPVSGGSAEVPIGRQTRWNLQVINDFKTRVFNLLQETTVDVNEEIEIKEEEGSFRIVPTNPGTEILFDTIELYNGIGDWEVVTEERIEEDAISGITLTTVFDNLYENWFDEVQMLEPITETVSIRTGATNTITLQNPVGSRDGFVIRNEAGDLITAIVNTGIGTNTVSINFALEPGQIYNITYLTPKRDNTTIVPGSIQLFSDGTPLVEDRDFIYSPVTGKILLVRNAGNIVLEDSILTASYTRRVEDVDLGSRTFFRTWVEVPRTTLVRIQPFTPSEVSAGNFHRIDDNDVSLETSFELQPGIHEITTTQPEPSARGIEDDSDVNIITGLKSNAGIVLENIPYRAFRFPMRRISLSDLEYNTRSGDRTVFSFNAGRILIPRKPSYIDQAILDVPTSTNTIGEFLRNKKLNPETSKYLSYPEQFLLRFAYRTPENKKFVRVRCIMDRGGDISPRIDRLGIAPVRTDLA